MITGVVNDRLEATVRLTLHGPGGITRDIIAVLDTGYNGALTLPLADVTALGLPQGASREVTLGDATSKVFDYYNAALDWIGLPRPARVLCVEGDPLIGTALLRHHKLEADFVPGGAVLIRPAPPAPDLPDAPPSKEQA